MSFEKTHRKLLGEQSLYAVAKIADEYRRVVPEALTRQRESAKVIALRVGATPRAVENWRNGYHGPDVPHFIALAREIPELRAKVMEWMNAASEIDPDTDRLTIEIARLVQSHMGKR